MKYRTIAFLWLVFIRYAEIFSQNIVPNGDFEYFDTCASGSGQIQIAIPWTDPNFSSSDYYNGCNNAATATVTVNPLPIVSANATATSICTGTSVTLTGGGAVTYVWDNGVQDGVPFSPSVTTAYTVTGTNSFGCSNAAGVVVSVNSLPDIQPITNINICDATNATWYTIPNYNSNYTYIISALSGTYYLNGISPVDNQGNFSINWNSQAVIYGSTLTITVIDGNTCSNSITIDMLACCDDGITPMFSNKNATDLINYYGIAGSLPTLSSETFIITGVFTVDQDLMLWDCNVLLNKDAIIIVSPNVTFTIDKSHLHACSNNMWRTIRVVGPHAHVETFAAVIEDADVAITSVSGGQYVLDETLFNKNHIGLSVSNYGGNMSNCVVVASFFTSRDFSGLDLTNSSAIQSAYATPSVVYPPANLLSGQRAYVGIEVNSMSTLSSNLSLGISNNPNYLVPISVNTFDYLQCGIHLTNSHARIVNNYFENIDYLHFPLQNYQVEGTAIYATSQSTLNSILTIGGANTLEPNFFNECRQGIYTNNCSAEIANNYFSNIYNDGAYVKNCKSRTLNIHDNYFDYAMSAIECNEINIATGISIKSNYVNMNTINSVVWSNGIVPVLGGGPLHSYYGIRVMNLNTVAIPSNLTINHNTIYNSITGIEVWRSVDFEVGPNNDINFLAGVAGSYEYGIKIKDCPSRAKVHDNTITRNSSVNPPDETSPVGVEVYNCSNARINSNTMTKMGTGILGEYNCLNSIFQCNEFITNYNGFRFANAAKINTQIDNAGPQSSGNNWHGNTGDPLHTIISTGWITGAIINPSKNWYGYTNNGIDNPNSFNTLVYGISFSNVSTPSNCGGVFHSPIEIRELLLGKIVRGENNYTEHSAEYLINDSVFAFNTLAKNDSMLNLGTTDDTLYKNYYNFVKVTNIGAFTKVDKFVLDSIQADTIQAKIVNDNIVTKNSMEDNQKIVNTIYLNQLTYEGDSLCTSNENYIFTEDEVQQLLNVAYQHPALGGDAVFQARIMLKMDIIDGNHSQRTMQLIPPKDSIANGNFKLFPNPNRGSMTLEYSLNSNDIGFLLIYDIAGKQLKSFKLPSENKMLNIDAAELSAGVYYYSIKVNDMNVKNDKLVIIN